MNGVVGAGIVCMCFFFFCFFDAKREELWSGIKTRLSNRTNE